MREKKMPRPFTPAGAFSSSTRPALIQHLDLVTADVHETQAAPGLNVLVAISADVERRAAEEMTVTVVAAVAMPEVSAVAMTTMTMTTMTMTARRSRGHRSSAERESGDDGE